MTPKIFGLAAALVKSRRLTLALIGVQFVYLGYKYLKEKDKIPHGKSTKALKANTNT